VERRRQNANIDNFAVVERPADRCGSHIAPVTLCDVAMTEESFGVPIMLAPPSSAPRSSGSKSTGSQDGWS
jgi:hypothetical protein